MSGGGGPGTRNGPGAEGGRLSPAPRPDVAPTPDAVRWLRSLVAVARGRRRALVHLQHNPDPDALASGVAFQYLLGRLLGIETVLVHTGHVGRSENRAMARFLGIQIIPSFKVEYSSYDLVIVVDTHPGSGTCRLPAGIVPDVVVDHHPMEGSCADVKVPFLDTRFGSTSTMIGWILVENHVPVSVRVATALVYGIKTDTQDLVRSDSPHDERVYREMYERADKKVLARIQRARLPQEYFQVLERGLRRARVTDFAVSTYLGAIGHGEVVAEIADILFRLEGTRWALVAGVQGPLLYASLRALRGEGVDAGRVAGEISDGLGGGHETFAAAQVPVPGDLSPEEFYEVFHDRFLKAIKAKKSLARPLTVPHDIETREDNAHRRRFRRGPREELAGP